MSVSLHRGAEQDLLHAARFYRDEGGAKLAQRFLVEFERVVALLQEFPGIGSPTDGGRRVHPLQGFPYSIIYSVTGSELRVLVVRAQLRDPEHGETRR